MEREDIVRKDKSNWQMYCLKMSRPLQFIKTNTDKICILIQESGHLDPCLDHSNDSLQVSTLDNYSVYTSMQQEGTKYI